jgi:hypothetical protein
MIPVSCIELSILESLYNPTVLDATYVNELVKQCVRKQRKKFDLTLRERLISLGKFHVSINRLWLLTKSLNHEYAQQLL